MIPEQDLMWMPTYGTLIAKQSEPAGVVDWNAFGWDALQVPDTTVKVQARMDILSERFYERYCDRSIAYETWHLWQVKLQDRFDSIVDKYERAYTLYEQYKDDVMDDVLPGRKTTVDMTNTVDGKTKFSETPDSSINDSDEFAGSITKNNGTNKNSGTTTEVITGNLLDSINATIGSWMDIDTAFVDEFETLFSKVWWYRWQESR